MSPFIAAHALGASLALVLGAVNLVRRPKGDRAHRVVGWVWVVAMYWTVISSAFIRQLNPGQFSWIHGLSVFTFVTLTLGIVAAVRGNVERHRGFVRGTWFGTVGAFVGAVAVPQRAVPQALVHHPWLVSVAAAGVLLTAFAIGAAAGAVRVRRADPLAVAAVPSGVRG